MPYTAQNVYDEVCDMLLEDGGLQFVYTEAAFLRDLQSSLVELCQEAGFALNFLNMPAQGGIAEYDLPSTAMDVRDVMWSERSLYKSASLDVGHYSDTLDREYGQPEEWYEDNLEANKIRLVPAPLQPGRQANVSGSDGMYGVIASTSNENDIDVSAEQSLLGTIASCSGSGYVEVEGPMLGTIARMVCSTGNVSVLATVRPQAENVALESWLELVPDSIASYLKWFVLDRIWSTDGESKDIARAKYARARRDELVNLISAINSEDIRD